MTTQAKERTQLEVKRVRTAKVTILLMLLALAILAVWQCTERSLAESSMPNFVAILNESLAEEDTTLVNETAFGSTDPNDSQQIDPLVLNQEGFSLMRISERGDILWYQSNWSVQQSRILLERALIHAGWESLSQEGEQVMSFSYTPNALVAGGTLVASFYPTEEGCSILIELL